MSKPSTLGGACIIASVCVGAGMLGLPSAGAGAWTFWSVIAISLTMVMMTLSGWLLLEALKHYNFKVSFNTITKDVLNRKINVINNLSLYFVGCILLYAYISSSGMIFSNLLGINEKLASVLFVAVCSAFVLHSTRAVDRISILLIVFMLVSFLIGISGLAANIQMPVLLDTTHLHASYSPYALALLPIALTSFGYHHSVSTMRDYYRDEYRAKNAILGGTFIALGFYLVWVLCIFGNLPRDAFGPVVSAGGGIDALTHALDSVIDSNSVKQAIRIFSIAAVVSSFIGVGLGVFDYLADLFGFEDSKQGRLKTWAITFIPPLLFSLVSPFGFLTAIGLAGAAATIWACIIPALLAKKTRQCKASKEGFVVPGGNVTVYVVIGFGVVTAVFHIMAMANLLPIFKG
ncbi:tryptophan permease [Photobacterium leiognathi lrivu.4.1]|uniref:Aromatic amino acid permease n=1 Tax=Photobacterium leiognathi lrivu.4.1 TaxID=1248232 RepID=A0A0U1P8F1_PHOLE|nr:aromatic amino acid transport family protein [Photobacterium leiognathi]GAD30655.1 tryptophan permease [Photobacterium leiognathi lrivu.4.1]